MRSVQKAKPRDLRTGARDLRSSVGRRNIYITRGTTRRRRRRRRCDVTRASCVRRVQCLWKCGWFFRSRRRRRRRARGPWTCTKRRYRLRRYCPRSNVVSSSVRRTYIIVMIYHHYIILLYFPLSLLYYHVVSGPLRVERLLRLRLRRRRKPKPNEVTFACEWTIPCTAAGPGPVQAPDFARPWAKCSESTENTSCFNQTKHRRALIVPLVRSCEFSRRSK